MSQEATIQFIREIIPLNPEHCSPLMLWQNLPTKFWQKKRLYIAPVRSINIPSDEYRFIREPKTISPRR